MSRVDSLGEAFQYRVPEKKKTGKKEKAGARTFSRLIERAEGEDPFADGFPEPDRRRSIEELLDAVFSAGDDLKKVPTIDRIKEYRRAVRAFMKYAVTHMIAVEETTSGVNIMKRKRFTLLKVIDRKLEDLAVSVLSTQSEQLAILAQIDEINGLLVDLAS